MKRTGLFTLAIMMLYVSIGSAQHAIWGRQAEVKFAFAY